MKLWLDTEIKSGEARSKAYRIFFVSMDTTNAVAEVYRTHQL